MPNETVEVGLINTRCVSYYVRETRNTIAPRTLWYSIGLERWTLSHPPIGWRGSPTHPHNGAMRINSIEKAQEAIDKWREDPDPCSIAADTPFEIVEVVLVAREKVVGSR